MNRRNAFILGIVELCLIIGIGVPTFMISMSGDSTPTVDKKLTTSTKIKIKKIVYFLLEILFNNDPNFTNYCTFFLGGPIWNAWGKWLNCTEDCGKNGTETRIRKCNDNCVEAKEVKEVRSHGPSIKSWKCFATCQGGFSKLPANKSYILII